MYRYFPSPFKRFSLIKGKLYHHLLVRITYVLALLSFFCSFQLSAQNIMFPQCMAEHESKMMVAPFTHLMVVDNNNSPKTANKLVVLYSMLVLSAGLFLVCRLKSSQHILTKYVFTLFRKHKHENSSTPENPSDRIEFIEIPVKNLHAISTETYNAILKKISKFEKSGKFLRKDINLTWLSNHLNTNTKYLSEVIKEHKCTNFNGYINGLRIQYIIKKLTETPVYRGYKISYLAEECGYASPQVFAIAFKRETGVTPSYFIEQFKNGPDNTLTKSSA
jgi:AraC-like DNA-binding protein